MSNGTDGFIRRKINGYKGILISTLIVIALGLGGWNLTAQVRSIASDSKQDTKIEDVEKRIDRFESRTLKQFEDIMEKLSELDKYVRNNGLKSGDKK